MITLQVRGRQLTFSEEELKDILELLLEKYFSSEVIDEKLAEEDEPKVKGRKRWVFDAH